MVNFDYKTINKTSASDTDTEHFIKAQDMNYAVKWSWNQMLWLFLWPWVRKKTVLEEPILIPCCSVLIFIPL